MATPRSATTVVQRFLSLSLKQDSCLSTSGQMALSTGEASTLHTQNWPVCVFRRLYQNSCMYMYEGRPERFRTVSLS